jgi:hypothetical protein
LTSPRDELESSQNRRKSQFRIADISAEAQINAGDFPIIHLAINLMNVRWRISVGLLLAVWCITACHRSAPGPLGGWERLKVSPVAGAAVLQRAEVSPCAWSVEANGKNVTVHSISGSKYERPHDLRIQSAGGTLIGEDRGEWVGGLSIVDASGGKPRTILHENVLQMYSSGNGVVVIAGDLPANQGSIWLFAKAEGRDWSIEKKTDLSGYPRAIGQSGDDILLAYGDGVSVVDSGFKEHRIANLPLLDIRPNSIARVAESDIYVGMNAFVVRLALGNNGYSQEWLTEQACLP